LINHAIRRYVTDNIAQLMRANLLEVFNQRDPNLRRAAIARIYADDIRWTDDDGVTVGHAALDAKASDVQLQLGDLQFVPASPVYKTIGLGYLAFHLVAREATLHKFPDSTSHLCETKSSSTCTPF
jgi:hypothetical protein